MSEPSFPPPAPAPPPAAPPGYAAYGPTNWSSDLKRVKALALWVTILLGLYALAQVVVLATIGGARDAARDFLDGELTAEEYDDRLLQWGAAQAPSQFLSLAIAVLSIIWLYRVVRNHRSIGRPVRWSPGWAIGGWFLPPFLFVIPLLILRESWRAAGSDTDSKSESPLIWAWFVIFGIAGSIAQVLAGLSSFNVSADREDRAEQLIDGASNLVIGTIIGIAGAIAWFLLVRALTARHVRLTGEATAR